MLELTSIKIIPNKFQTKTDLRSILIRFGFLLYLFALDRLLCSMTVWHLPDINRKGKQAYASHLSSLISNRNRLTEQRQHDVCSAHWLWYDISKQYAVVIDTCLLIS